ncbi:MAG: IclR family transcriptional regulator, partial [Pigmentiphaga sp.]
MAKSPGGAGVVQNAGAKRSGREPGVTEIGTLARAMHLLRLLATAGRRGLGLTELAQTTGLPHPTAHRLLRQLIDERMASQDESTRRYRLGRMAFELGLAATAMYDLRGACHGPLRELAERVGDTVYLTVRSGLESVCEDRYEGPSPIRVFTLDIGSRRPLGQGAGGLAILSFLPDDERDQVLEAVVVRMTHDGVMAGTVLRQAVVMCRRRGYAWIRDRVTEGVSAVGVPLFDSLGQPVAAIS